MTRVDIAEFQLAMLFFVVIHSIVGKAESFVRGWKTNCREISAGVASRPVQTREHWVGSRPRMASFSKEGRKLQSGRKWLH